MSVCVCVNNLPFHLMLIAFLFNFNDTNHNLLLTTTVTNQLHFIYLLTIFFFGGKVLNMF